MLVKILNPTKPELILDNSTTSLIEQKFHEFYCVQDIQKWKLWKNDKKLLILIASNFPNFIDDPKNICIWIG